MVLPVTSVVFFIPKGDKFLFLKDESNNTYVFPRGLVETKEQITAAALRILWEKFHITAEKDILQLKFIHQTPSQFYFVFGVRIDPRIFEDRYFPVRRRVAFLKQDNPQLGPETKNFLSSIRRTVR